MKLAVAAEKHTSLHPAILVIHSVVPRFLRDTLLKSALYENTSQLLEIYEQSLSRHSAGHRVAQLRMKPDNVRIRSRARNFPGKKLEVGERNNFFQLCLLKRGFI